MFPLLADLPTAITVSRKDAKPQRYRTESVCRRLKKAQVQGGERSAE
jgi:hypothetical protein